MANLVSIELKIVQWQRRFCFLEKSWKLVTVGTAIPANIKARAIEHFANSCAILVSFVVQT